MFFKQFFSTGLLIGALLLGVSFALPAEAAGLCCAYSVKSSDGKPSGDPQYKVNFTSAKDSCPTHETADKFYVGTMVESKKICSDKTLTTFQEATYQKEFDEYWKKVTEAGAAAIVNGIMGTGKAVAEGVESTGKAINKASSVLNHGSTLLGPNAFFPFQTLNKQGKDSVGTILGKWIKTAMGVVGSIAFAMFIYAGILWMVSGGSSDKTQKAKDILLWTSLGIAIIFASYALVDIVFEAFRAETPPQSAPK